MYTFRMLTIILITENVYGGPPGYPCSQDYGGDTPVGSFKSAFVLNNDAQVYFRLYAEFFAGILTQPDCKMECSCKGFSYMAHDPCNHYCSCGNEIPESIDECIHGYMPDVDNCVYFYNADATIRSSFAETPTTTRVLVNTPVAFTSGSADWVTSYGFVTDGRLTETTTPQFENVFGMSGNHSVAVEFNAFYNCPSEPVHIQVVPETQVELTLTETINTTVTTTTVYFKIFGPEDLSLAKLHINDEVVEFQTPAGSLYAEVGGNHETDRFATYNRTFGDNSPPLTVINLDYMTPDPGVVTGFSAYVTELGSFTFFLVKMVCESTTKPQLCFKKCSCVSAGHVCPSAYNIFKPETDNDVFLMKWMRFGTLESSEEYVPNEKQFLSNMPDKDETGAAEAVSLQVVGSFNVTATQLGHQVFPVPKCEQFNVDGGVFLGWSPAVDNPGDIAFREVDLIAENKWPQLVVTELFDDVVPGLVFSSLTDASQQRNIASMISVFIEYPADYEYHIDTSKLHIGKNNISVTLFDYQGVEAASHAKLLTLAEPVANLTVTAPSAVVYGEQFQVTAELLSGSVGAEYCVAWYYNLGKEKCEDYYTSAEAIFKNLTFPGAYTGLLKAYNAFSETTATFDFRVLCELPTLKFVDDQVGVKETGQPLEVFLIMNGCGEVALNISLVGSESEENYAFDVVVGRPTYLELITETFMQSAGNMSVIVNVTVGDQSVVLENFTAVQVPIAAVDFDSNPVEWKQTHNFRILPQAGTDQLYCIDFGVEGEEAYCTEFYDTHNLEHVYEESGKYTVNVTAWNRVSQVSLTKTISVERPVSSCELVIPPSIFTTPTEARFTVDAGTDLHIFLYWIRSRYDGKVKSITNVDIGLPKENISFILDFSPGFMGIARYVYPRKEDSVIELQVSNLISSTNCFSPVLLEDPIEGLELTFVQAESGTEKLDYIEETEMLCFNISHNIEAERTHYEIDLGNGETLSTSNKTFCYAYAQWGLFNATVNAKNPVSQAFTYVMVDVKRPLVPILLTGCKHAPENSTETMVIELHFNSGNWFNCSFNASDGSALYTHVYPDYVDPGAISARHQFKAGTYNVSFNCSNRLYEQIQTCYVLSQDPIVHDGLVFSGISKTGIESPPKGHKFDSFNVQDSVKVTVIDLVGSNISSSVRLSINNVQHDLRPLINESAVLHHQVYGSSSYAGEVVVTLWNQVQIVVIRELVYFFEPIYNLTMTITSEEVPSIFADTEFEITVPNSPMQPCIVVQLIEVPGYVFGPNCVGGQYGDYIKKVVQVDHNTPIRFSHRFLKPAVYNIKLLGINSVSQVEETYKTKVIDFPCSPPEGQFKSCVAQTEEEVKSVANFYRCKNATFVASVKTNCMKPNSDFVKSLSIEHRDNVTRKWSTVVPFTVFEGKYLLVGKDLDYGLHKAVIKISMRDKTTDKIIDGTDSYIKGFFLISPCDLVAVVDAGNEITVVKGGILAIDASQSYDPDDNFAELVPHWYISTRGYLMDNMMEPRHLHLTAETMLYPRYPSDDESHFQPPYGGIFSKSPLEYGRLADKGHNSLLLTLNTDFMGYGCYNLYFELQKYKDKFKRRTFFEMIVCLLEDPPAHPVLVCKNNCNSKINSDQRFSIEANVTNSYLCNSSVHYNWTVFRQRKSNALEAYVDVSKVIQVNMTTILSGTSLESRNFGVKAYTLHPAYKYKFRLEAICDGLLPGISGLYRTINTVPNITDAQCTMSARHGYAMLTTFNISCSGVKEEDLPLTYSFYYKCRKADYEPITAATSVFPVVSPNFKLPSGDETNRDKCLFKVVVKDVFGLKSAPITQDLDVKVVPSKAFLDLKEKSRKRRAVDYGTFEKEEVSEEEKIEELKMCDDLAATSESSMINYLTVINEMLMDMSPALSKHCKEQIMKTLKNVPMDSPDALSSVLGNVQIDADAESGLASLENVVDAMLEMDADDLTDFALQMMAKTASMANATNGENAADVVSQAMEMEAKVSAAVASKLMTGEPPVVTENAAGKTEMRRLDMTGVQPVGGFAMPSMGAGSFGAVNSAGDNRFGFNKNSDSVKGKVKGMSLTNPNGTPMKVANLTEPIHLVLENEEEMPPPKNFTAYCRLMRDIHRVDVTMNTSVMILHATPLYDNFTGYLFLFLNKGSAPSLAEHQQNCTLPNPYPEHWTNMTLAEQDLWEREFKWRCYFSEQHLNATAIGVWCVGVIFYTNGTNMTEELLPRSSPVSDDNCTEPVKYSFFAYTRACLYWNKEIRDWDSEGCVAVEKDTHMKQTMCACDHLTHFGGGGPFADAEPLDLGGALRNMNIKENPTVFSIVMATFGLYLILLIWCRRKDVVDKKKNQVITLVDNHPNDAFFYEVIVETGFKPGCSTTADVVIDITGSEGESSPRRLFSPDRKTMQQGETDSFVMSVPKSMGIIKEVTLWHNNGGISPGWFCHMIQVWDMQTGERVDFLCNQWLDVAEDDGSIIRQLTPSLATDLTNFRFLFTTLTRRNLYDGHVWLSVFTRPAQSKYTRCQRLATCLALLLMSMVTNAMFYRGDMGIPSGSITVGPFTFSVDEIKISFTVALMIIPVHLVIIMLFKYAGPKNFKYEQEEKVEEALNEERKDGTYSRQRPQYGKWVRFFRSLLFPGAEDDRQSRKPLPYWLVHLAYAFCAFVTLISAFFVCMYGFAFGKIKSDKFIVSFLFSFLYDFFLLQPLKVILLSFLFAILLQPPQTKVERGQKSNTGGSEEAGEEEMMSILNQDMSKFKLPDELRLQEARTARMKEKRIKIIIKEVFVHLSFVFLTVVVGYSNLDPAAYRLHHSVQQLCAFNGINQAYYGGSAYVKADNGRNVPTADAITTRLEWWDWIRYSVIDYLFNDGWYDSAKSRYPKGFVSDGATSKVLAMARIRQLRVNPQSCTKHPALEHLIVECNAGYSWTNENTDSYRAGWLPALNYTERLRRRRGKRKSMWKGLEDPWLYQTATELKSPFPFTGKFATYNGAAYSVSIGPDKQVAKRIVKEMKKDFWVDRYTRALFTEINLFNANTNLILIVTFLHEILPTGGWNFYSNVQAIRLYRYVGDKGNVVMLFDVIFCAVTIYGLYKSIRAARKNGFKVYMTNFWNILHVIVTTSSIAAIAFTFGRMFAVKEAVGQYYEEPELFVSFQIVGALEYLIEGSLGFVLFFTTLEFLRILRFNHLIAMLIKTISILGTPLASFGMIFFVVFFAYVSFAHCIYVDKLEEFQSVMSSFVSLTKMFMGKFDVHDYFDNAPFFGPLMFGSYMLAIQMIMINLFVGLICDAFAEVGEDEGPDEEPSVLGFMSTRVKEFGTGEKGVEPLYCDWKSELEQSVDKLESSCDSCIYIMRNMEGEELRNEKFFRKDDSLGAKKLILLAVLGSDDIQMETELCDALLVLEKKLKETKDLEALKDFVEKAAKRKKIYDLERAYNADDAHPEDEASNDDASNDDVSGASSENDDE